MNLSLRAFNEMFPDEDAARAWFEKARWAERPRVLSLRGGWQRALHAKDRVLALQGMREAVQRHGRHADAPDTSAATDMGSGDLSDRVLVEGHLGSEAE